jgi:hypothetical protein
MRRLHKVLVDRAAQRKEIHGLLADLGLAIDDAFEM